MCTFQPDQASALAAVSPLLFLSVILFIFLLLLIFKIFIYLFLAALGLPCCSRAFSSCGESGGYSSLPVRGLLIAVAFLVAEHRL